MANGRWWIVLLVAAVCLVGCRPRGVLSSRQMRDVIYDLHRADAVIIVAGYTAGGYEEETKACYRSVMAKHGITQAQFDSSLVWYTNHPAFFEKIYPKVKSRVEEELAYWTKKEERERQLEAVRMGTWRYAIPADMQKALWNMSNTCPEAIPPIEAQDYGDFSIKMRIFIKKYAK